MNIEKTEIVKFYHELKVESKFLDLGIQLYVEQKVRDMLSEGGFKREEPLVRIRKVVLFSIKVTNDQSNIATVEIHADCVKPTIGKIFVGKVDTLIPHPGLAILLIEEKVPVFVKQPPESMKVGDFANVKITNQRFTKGNLKLMGSLDI
ncbi:hypothetical protein IIV31_090R [Armadillidium vulgare iridescent virus]|uniref:Uncharacterized protein n=1 Tax=Armadillidium vulgare iridescent virus TaxID=72201 RepID=A0A068QKB2_9VIRU|nr:hypothetical protein IIV31_090R [Armadillidium vulgare iridescent virus]CCV02462.1 hypothetical protein IIV31_090R [Armadillidium vulgare iridescent virus]